MAHPAQNRPADRLSRQKAVISRLIGRTLEALPWQVQGIASGLTSLLPAYLAKLSSEQIDGLADMLERTAKELRDA